MLFNRNANSFCFDQPLTPMQPKRSRLSHVTDLFPITDSFLTLIIIIMVIHILHHPYKNFTCTLTDENNIKISYGKLVFIRECSISYVKYMFCIPRFHMWNFQPVQYTWFRYFICEKVPISHVFHMWNHVKFP